MAWWKSDGPETGQISPESPIGYTGQIGPSTHHKAMPTGFGGRYGFVTVAIIPDKVVNAIPGPDDCYNGDGPAGVMGNALAEISALYKIQWGRRAKPDELRACFNFCLNGRMRAGKTASQPPGEPKP